MNLISKIALLSDLTLCPSKRIILRQDSDGPCELAEEIILILRHFLHKRLRPLIRGQLVIHNQQPFVIQYVSVVIVVQFHGRAPIVPHILYGLRVGYSIGALVQHVLNVLRVQGRVDLRVEAVDQLHTVGPPHTVSTCVERIR